jgi:hypothetical protein
VVAVDLGLSLLPAQEVRVVEALDLNQVITPHLRPKQMAQVREPRGRDSKVAPVVALEQVLKVI